MASHARLCLRVTGATLIGVALSSSLAAQNPKRFFVGPSFFGGIDEYKKIFDPAASWPLVKRQGDVFEVHVNSLRPDPFNIAYLDDNTLEDAVHTLGSAQLEVGVFAGGLRHFPGGADPANWAKAGETLAKIEGTGYGRWTHLGGTIDVLMLDSPFGYALQDMGMPWDVAAGELADYLDQVVGFMPGVEIGLIEPVPHYVVGQYPTWGPKHLGNLPDLLATVLPILHARGHDVSFFLADSPYTYTDQTPGGWKKLVLLEKVVRKLGLRFGWFVNDSKGGSQSDALFFLNSINGLRKLHEAGGNPDDFNIRSWYVFPKKTVPESSPLTFTGITRKLMEYVYGHFEAPNKLSHTVSFDDGALEPFVLDQVSSTHIVNGRLAMSSAGKFKLPRHLYQEPTIIVRGSMVGMLPGSSADVVLRAPKDSVSYVVSLVSQAGGKCYVQLRSSDAQSGASEVLAVGKTVPVDPLQDFHLIVRQAAGFLRVDVNKYTSLVHPSPITKPSLIAFGASSQSPFVGQVLFDLIDIREKRAITNITVDKKGRIVFSLVSEDFLPAFDKSYWLNVFDGEIVSFDDFSSKVMPAMEVLALRNDYVVMRTLQAVPPGSIISLVYDGDFESILLK